MRNLYKVLVGAGMLKDIEIKRRRLRFRSWRRGTNQFVQIECVCPFPTHTRGTRAARPVQSRVGRPNAAFAF